MANQLIHFGKLSCLYEDGFIRYVRSGEVEILRKIYFALRDASWVTADIRRTDERISVTWKGFEISYTATNVVDGKDVYRWHVKITGNEEGEIDFAVDGEALAAYNRNRAGICVLHPIRETKDKAVKVTRPDGSVYEDKFPAVIDPQQPFMDICKMSWQLNDESWAELDFEGDVFEMEDQRNWSDTSFKTYSTPLSVPYPVMLKPGDKISQRVKLKLLNAEGLSDSDSAEDIEVTIHEGDSNPFPKIGFEFPGVPAAAKEVELIKLLKPEHLRVELIISSPNWKAKLTDAIVDCSAIGTNLFLHVVLNDVEEWNRFESEVTSMRISIQRLAISPLDRKANMDQLLQHVLPKARKLFPGVLIGAGYRSYFTELNRNRFDYKNVDFLVYPVTPTAHASDSLTIIENLPAQEDAIKTANVFAPGKKIVTGPISLRLRFNPDAKTGSPEVSDTRFDPRQETPLAAGWALATIKYLSEGGADTITLFESHGRAGYLIDGKLFPIYNALLAIQQMNPKRVIHSECNDQLVVTSLVLEDEKGKRHLVLINHTNAKRFVSVGEMLYTLTDFEIQFISMK